MERQESVPSSPQRTQDIPAMDQHEFWKLNPDYVTEPPGRIKMTRTTFWALVSLRVYLVIMLGLGFYRFAQLAHWIK